MKYIVLEVLDDVITSTEWKKKVTEKRFYIMEFYL